MWFGQERDLSSPGGGCRGWGERGEGDCRRRTTSLSAEGGQTVSEVSAAGVLSVGLVVSSSFRVS